MMRFLTLAAVVRQTGVGPSTAKKFLSKIPDVRVDVNGRIMYREDVLLEFIRNGGNQEMPRPAGV
jgi:hypothetical protein